MVELTFPQAGDLPDAAYFAFLVGRGRSGIISGLTLSPDFSVPEVTVAPGKAIIDRGDMTTAHPNIDPSESVSDAVAVVEIDAQTRSLTSGAVNEIFIDATTTSDDSATVVATTSGSAPTSESLKIGEVDTSTDTASEQWNKIEEDGSLSFPDADAARDVLASLPAGVGGIDRSNGVLIFDDQVSVDALEAGDSFTDPAGNTFTGPVPAAERALAFQFIGL